MYGCGRPGNFSRSGPVDKGSSQEASPAAFLQTWPVLLHQIPHDGRFNLVVPSTVSLVPAAGVQAAVSW